MTNTQVNGNVSTNNESTTNFKDTTITGNFTSDANAKVSMDGGTNVIGTTSGTNITKTYTVSFEGIGEQEYTPNAVLTIPEAPSISGATGFLGWTDGKKVYLPGETYTVTGNVTFKALFETAPEEEEIYIPSTPISDGIHEYSLGKMLYIDGKRVKGLYEYEGATYYFNEQGFMQAETWVQLEDGWYYFAEDGKMKTGWLKLGNTWYYLDPDTGRMYDNGLATIGKYTYYFYDWGGMANDWWYEAEDGWYFFGGDGAMKAACWLQWKGAWYYLTETGRMAVSADIGGYYVNADGVWVP